jgi:ParB/RepB/Spo0J family partition protein
VSDRQKRLWGKTKSEGGGRRAARRSHLNCTGGDVSKKRFTSDLSQEWAVRDGANALTSVNGDAAIWIDLERIRPNPYQPRRLFDEAKLAELAEDIRVNGILEPAMGRPESDGGVTLIFGERRLRAARALGLKRLPVVLRNASESEMADWALSENMRRADLHPLEEALALARCVARFGSQENAAKALNVKRSTLAAKVRYAALPPSVQDRLLRIPDVTFHMLRPLASLGDDERALLEFCAKLHRESLGAESFEADNSNEINDVAVATNSGRRRAAESDEVKRFTVRSVKGVRITVRLGATLTRDEAAHALAETICEVSRRIGADAAEIMATIEQMLPRPPGAS